MSIKKQALKWLLTVNDILQATLSVAMTNSQWLLAFNTSPAPFIVKPLLGLVLMSLLLFQAHELYQTNQLLWVHVLELLGNGLNISFTNIAIFGGLVATLLKTTFVAGPWFLVSALGIGLVQQMGMLFFNLVQARQADCTSTRAHFLQAAINNSVNWLLIASTLVTIIFVVFLPAAPIALGSAASLCVVFLVATMSWRMLPDSYRQQIKQGLGLGKDTFKEHALDSDKLGVALQTTKDKTFPPEPSPIARSRSLSFWHNNELVKNNEENQLGFNRRDNHIKLRPDSIEMT